jgi:hypothetical protein
VAEQLLAEAKADLIGGTTILQYSFWVQKVVDSVK